MNIIIIIIIFLGCQKRVVSWYINSYKSDLREHSSPELMSIDHPLATIIVHPL